MNERGALSIVVVTGALSLCLAALAVADLGSLLVARARAQAAAEAAALAAVVEQAPALSTGEGPAAAAERLASDNGARLLDCACETGRSWAAVSVDVPARAVIVTRWIGRRARATATAEVDPDVLTYRAPPSPAPD